MLPNLGCCHLPVLVVVQQLPFYPLKGKIHEHCRKSFRCGHWSLARDNKVIELFYISNPASTGVRTLLFEHARRTNSVVHRWDMWRTSLFVSRPSAGEKLPGCSLRGSIVLRAICYDAERYQSHGKTGERWAHCIKQSFKSSDSPTTTHTTSASAA